jgi:hypothetical protein
MATCIGKLGGEDIARALPGPGSRSASDRDDAALDERRR